MQAILALTADRKAKLEAHPFFDWVKNSKLSLRERLDFAPIMANFVMNFRDMNKWFIRFDLASNEFEEIINGNTDEDETHSRLFIEDWRKLHLDEKLKWRASDALWWLFLAKETEPFRGYAFDFARMTVVDGGDSLMRFAHSEAGEACGNAFFSILTPLAVEIRRQTSIDYRYFGDHHLDRELGHVIASEGIFDRQKLDTEQRRKGLELANAMFDIFFGMHDRFYDYACNYVESGSTPQRERSELPHLRAKLEPTASAEPQITGHHAVVEAVIQARKARTARHPFYAWLRDENKLSSLVKLQRFIPMWVMDIMGYRDLNRYALRFGAPQNDQELAFNRWTDALETHSELFMNDWDALAMDDALQWSASETLNFLFLDPNSDVHRRNIASFIKLAIAHESSNLRFWLLEALEASGEAFFTNTRTLAQDVERRHDVRLDYLADRHHLLHPGDDLPDPSRSYPFKSQPLSPEEAGIAITMVNTVFDAVDEQLTLSLKVAKGNYFNIAESRPSAMPTSAASHPDEGYTMSADAATDRL